MSGSTSTPVRTISQGGPAANFKINSKNPNMGRRLSCNNHSYAGTSPDAYPIRFLDPNPYPNPKKSISYPYHIQKHMLIELPEGTAKVVRFRGFPYVLISTKVTLN